MQRTGFTVVGVFFLLFAVTNGLHPQLQTLKEGHTPTYYEYYSSSQTTLTTDEPAEIRPDRRAVHRHKPKNHAVAAENGNAANLDFHFPYRVKFPACAELGICKLEDFKFDKEADKLGKGGFGQVYRAVHLPSNATVALKLTTGVAIKEKPKYVELEETMQHFLEHPFIGRMLCSMSDPSTHDVYFVLEYFASGTLSKTLDKLYPLAPSIMAKYMGQVILALRYMHSRCVVYRDLKMENVMLDANDDIKLIDFGLSLYDCDNQLTHLSGTMEYVAPEVAGRIPHGRASDYYSAGVLMYVIVTGKHPYRRGKMKKPEFVKRVFDGEYPIPATGNADADQVIAILTQYDAARRWRDVFVNFDSFKRLPFFSSFDWDYYEQYPFYMHR